ncbi:hypothetical protein NMY22_g17805 [Coprinellus aureogranulatus]|nr:hypothetical protein NMY22_g17805 [Coprinellus aureogranulatus]
MRLSSLAPAIPDETIAHLEACNIRTDSDLLFTPLFDLYKKLPRDTLTLQDLARLRKDVTELVAAEPILGSDLLEAELRESEQDAELRVGDDHIDELLCDLGGKRVIEISGDRGTGKSTLALNIALYHLLEHANEIVAWVDTQGDFSPGAVYDFLGSHGQENADSVLERLQVSLAFDCDTLYALLDEMFESTIGARPRILVIDTVTPLFGPILSGITSHGHAVMTDLMLKLRTIANAFRCTVLVINNSTLKEPYDASKKNQERKPALGPSFTFMTDTTLWLSRKAVEEGEEGDSANHLEILKSRTKVTSSLQLGEH